MTDPGKVNTLASTQVRISEATHAVLHALAVQSGESMQSIVEKAIEQYRRKAFLEGLSRDFLKLREDSEDGQDDDDESGDWETTLPDGLGLL